jgi:cytidylate kinase
MISIALDGPAGAGKSTIAQEVARRLSILHVDTGALYRAVGLFALRQEADPADPEQVLPLLPKIHVSLSFTPEGQRIYLNGEDVSEAIREPRASMAASAVSAIPKVREFLLDLQRDLAKANNVIMDGRDIGTVVLPDATVKIFLTADPEARAMRRYKELIQKGCQVDYESVLRDVRERDYNDSHRATAPLRQAEDAWFCDTTHLDLAGSIDTIVEYIKGRTAL